MLLLIVAFGLTSGLPTALPRQVRRFGGDERYPAFEIRLAKGWTTNFGKPVLIPAIQKFSRGREDLHVTINVVEAKQIPPDGLLLGRIPEGWVLERFFSTSEWIGVLRVLPDRHTKLEGLFIDMRSDLWHVGVDCLSRRPLTVREVLEIQRMVTSLKVGSPAQGGANTGK